MDSPFTDAGLDLEDQELVASAQSGNRQALELLVVRHQAWVYNIAVRMLLWTEAAEDATQDILIKMIAGLEAFRGDSRFRTWLYRIAVNNILNLKKKWAVAEAAYTYDYFARDLDETPDRDLPDPRSMSIPVELLVEEAKIGCMTAMLLCLDGRQRLAFTLGEVFGVTDKVGAEVMGVTAGNFRQILSRARQDLYSFMNGKCGLIDGKNSCHCPRKTRGFLERGYLNPARLQFAVGYRQRVREVVPDRLAELGTASERLCAELYREQPFRDVPAQAEMVRRVLASVALEPPA
jgi:RNA polymerase sigma factor (sigma-70 family)